MPPDNPYQSPESESSPPKTGIQNRATHKRPTWRFWVLLSIASFAVVILILNVWAAVVYSWSLEWRLVLSAITAIAIFALVTVAGVVLLLWHTVVEAAHAKVASLQARLVAIAIVGLAIFDGLTLLIFFTAVLMPTWSFVSNAKPIFGFALGCLAAFEVMRIAKALWRDAQARP